MFLPCANGPDQVELESGVIDAAVRAGIRRLVKLSVLGAKAGSPVLDDLPVCPGGSPKPSWRSSPSGARAASTWSQTPYPPWGGSSRVLSPHTPANSPGGSTSAQSNPWLDRPGYATLSRRMGGPDYSCATSPRQECTRRSWVVPAEASAGQKADPNASIAKSRDTVAAGRPTPKARRRSPGGRNARRLLRGGPWCTLV